MILFKSMCAEYAIVISIGLYCEFDGKEARDCDDVIMLLIMLFRGRSLCSFLGVLIENSLISQ